MATKAETLRAALVEATARVVEELAKYSDDNPPNAEQLKQLEDLKAKVHVAKAEMDTVENYSKLNASWEEQEAFMREAGNRAPLATRLARGDIEKAPASIGQRFTQNADFQEWLKAVAPNGVIPDSKKGLNSPSLGFKGFRELEMHAALITGESSTSAGSFVTPTYYPGLTELGRRPLTIRDVVTNLQTDSDVIEFVRITTETNAAAPVAEATAAAGGSGVKPESTLGFERVSTPVKTIAHWIPATKRALSDAAQLRGLIDAFLRYGLEEELEDQIANGDGVGENFTGILNTANTQSQAWDTDLFQTLRVAKRKVRTVGRRTPTAYILNPEDWEQIELMKDNQNRYYGNGPFSNTTPQVWALPVVESEAIPVGTGLVGDFRTCVLWDREQANISVSDSHMDFFIRNLVAILAELRAAFGVLKPSAIVEIDLTA